MGITGIPDHVLVSIPPSHASLWRWPLLSQKEFCTLTASQEIAPCVLVAEGVMVLLRRCLEVEAPSRVAVSGYVDHYCSMKNDDLGWGCGWRNIQVQHEMIAGRE